MPLKTNTNYHFIQYFYDYELNNGWRLLKIKIKIKYIISVRQLPGRLVGWLVLWHKAKSISLQIIISIPIRSLIIKTVRFQIIQFSIRTHFRFIWHIKRTLSGATAPNQMAMKGCSAFPKVPELLEPHHQIVKSHVQENRLEWVLPLWRDPVGVSTAPAKWASGRPGFNLSSSHTKDLKMVLDAAL